jgi:hypothetical protein
MNVPAAATYEGQLALRATELMPHVDLDERLELLGVMEPDDMRGSLAFLAGLFPQMFDFSLVRDRALVDRLYARLDETRDDGDPYCTVCSGSVGIFHGHGDGWHHYRGEGTAASPVELFDAGHVPVVAWRTLADAR